MYSMPEKGSPRRLGTVLVRYKAITKPTQTAFYKQRGKNFSPALLPISGSAISLNAWETEDQRVPRIEK